jgi:putative FmdB family regulatory protein
MIQTDSEQETLAGASDMIEVMPLFEYACQECDKQFELLVRGSEIPECPSCHSTALQRRLSVFAAHTNGSGSASSVAVGACGTCGDPRGPGSCSMN